MEGLTVNVGHHPKQEDVTLLTVKGYIDTTTAPEFEKAFQSVLNSKKFKIVIDLKDVNYISSAGWGIFIGEIKRIRNQKGDLFLSGMNGEVTEVFELLEFNTILKAFPDVETALQKGFKKDGV
jgi:anti-sigma B factor antagonist